MVNLTVIEDAINLTINILEAERITESTATIKNRILTWYNNSDICDAETLATCAIVIGNYDPTILYSDILKAKEIYFPSNPYDEYAIWEIEASQYDMFLQALDAFQ